ncbi:MAG: AAA family ATPase, partial [Planctomycetota bacterium]
MTPADLFAQSEAENLAKALPLAAAMRPTSLDEVVGQRQLLDEGKLLRRMVRSGQLGSIILYGPPGTGKTTLAGLLASETGSQMRSVSAVTSGVKELRQEIQRARETVASGERRPVLFVDEIHRFSKTQQDALLPDVEQGTITLIGATTSNPFFAVNNALISRSQIFALEALEDADIVVLLRRAITDSKRGLGRYGVSADEAALLHLAAASEGDARKALSCLEIAVRSMYGFGEPSSPPLVLSLGDAKSSVQQKSTAYDGTGDDHYDLASALIKSIRGSDADAAV